MSLIRYPGSKAKLVESILAAMPEEYVLPMFTSDNLHYVEPFFGSGAVGFEVMKRLHHRARVTIADMDIGLFCLWLSVWKHADELKERIRKYRPSVESFYELKQLDGEFTDTVDTGFRKLALHRISVSGFGVMAGGPIGGRKQEGAYTVGCRWKPAKMLLAVERYQKLLGKFKRLEILHSCVFKTLAGIDGDEPAFIYLDPPYYEKGNQLYKHGFSEEQHAELASVLIKSRHLWAVSYDDHPAIRRLYHELHVRKLEVTYSNAVCRSPSRRKHHEILIAPHPLVQAR